MAGDRRREVENVAHKARYLMSRIVSFIDSDAAAADTHISMRSRDPRGLTTEHKEKCFNIVTKTNIRDETMAVGRDAGPTPRWEIMTARLATPGAGRVLRQCPV
jgi:hypothetical protein